MVGWRHFNPWRRGCACLAVVLMLSACAGLNAVDTIPSGQQVSESGSSAFVLVGFASRKSDRSSYGVGLSAYDTEKKTSVGNCFRHDRGSVFKKTPPTSREYVLFRVPGGEYVVGNGGRLRDGTITETMNGFRRNLEYRGGSFRVHGGDIVYVGDFIYLGEGRSAISKDLQGAAVALAAYGLPSDKMTVFDPTPVIDLFTGYVCTP